MAGNQCKSCRVCDFLYPACLCRLSYSGISHEQAAGAFRQSEAGLPEKGICPCRNCLCDVGLWCCGDFGRDVYPDVPVADRVCTVMPVPASACPCPEKGELEVLSAACCYGVSRIPDTVLLYYFSFLPGSRILPVSFEGKEMEEPCGLCGNVCSSPWGSACLLSFGTFPYFQGIPWNGGGRRVYQCFQYPGTNTVFCRTF